MNRVCASTGVSAVPCWPPASVSRLERPSQTDWLPGLVTMATDSVVVVATFGRDWPPTGTFTLVPNTTMRNALRKDYDAMAGMIFGDIPPFDAVLHSAEHFEQIVNEAAMAALTTKGM